MTQAEEGVFTRIFSHFIYFLLLICHHFDSLLRTIIHLPLPLPSNNNNNSDVCPKHIALAALIDTAARTHSVARLALAAEQRGARNFSVCALYGSRPDVAAAIRTECLHIGVSIDVRVRPAEPRAAIVRYTRALASTPIHERDCDVNDADSVVRSLDSWHAKHELVGEPDVLVFAPGHAHCMASFSVWQLRLTQFRFARCPVDKLPESMFSHLICSAYGVAKRFGK